MEVEMKAAEQTFGDAPFAPRPGLWLVSTSYRRYVVALIWLTLLLRFVDLQIISVLLEAIRKEFAVSDAQLGLLSGFAFSVLYGSLGIPVAWLADRYGRRGMIAAAVGLWSLMTALCGAAGSFTSLLLARVGVGVGEAGGTAPAYSLISALIPAARRASVFAILSTSVPAGVFVGFLLGGWMSRYYGWRAPFLVLGIVGLTVALVVRLTLSNPTEEVSVPGASADSPSIAAVIRTLLRIRSYRHFVLASSIFTAGAMGSGSWITSFFVRVHHMPVVEVATWLAFIYGGGGVAGAIFGGLAAERLVARTGDSRWYGWLAAAMAAAIVPFALCVYLWDAPVPALLMHIGTVFLMHAWLGPVYGTIQTLAGPTRRAIAAALNMLAINLIAYGSGPLLVGIASDWIKPFAGQESLRYAILSVVTVTYLWAAVHFALASRTIRADLARA
jgi:predicted MFS family arabinose efflux permease